MNQFKKISYVCLIIPLVCSLAEIALAQRKSFDDLILAVEADRVEGVVTGNTGGSYSLASITNRDRQGNPCMGYGDPQPDHIVTLKGNFKRLTWQIDSRGSDTTLLVKNIDNNYVRCGFGSGSSKDAVIQDGKWSAGTYHIWVGSMSPNQRSSYRLSIEP